MEREENALETALRRAADDPVHRPEFERLLLESKILVLGTTDSNVGSDGVLRAGSNVHLTHWQEDGQRILPFFTSIGALQRAIAEDAEYIKLDARALFEFTLGATLRLNGGSDYGRYFLPHEIDSLLATGSSSRPETRVLDRATEVRFATVKNPPEGLLAALSRLFEKTANVKTAHLALISWGAEAKPVLLFGIEVDGPFDRISADTWTVASAYLPEGEPVEIMQIGPGKDGASDYFNKRGHPFYQRVP
jgi:hypothetical protein